MKVIVFSSPGREEMLDRLIQELELKGMIDHDIIADPQTYGKENFWKRWEQARQMCLDSDQDDFMIIPDDICQIDLKTVKDLHGQFRDDRFMVSIISDGRLQCWGSTPRADRYFNMNGYQFKDLQFFDCGGVTNRKTLKSFKVEPIKGNWFDEPGKSSGVGAQITRKLKEKRIPMYQVEPSLSYHGMHESKMHPSERKNTPLVSIPKRPKVVIGMATFGVRDEFRKKTIDSLIGQADRIIIYNNDDNPDLVDNAKFYGLKMYQDPQDPVYYFTVDDDIIYPPTYVEDMITAIELHKCIVTHHGRIVENKGVPYYRGHKAIHCLQNSGADIEVTVPGTGVCAWRTDYFLPKDLHNHELQRMSDCIFALEVAKQGKKIMALKHKKGYFKYMDVPIESTIHTTEHKKAHKQREICDQIIDIKASR